MTAPNSRAFRELFPRRDSKTLIPGSLMNSSGRKAGSKIEGPTSQHAI